MKVLVISVHPDDETLGCGGTLLKHYAHGDQLFWIIITKPDIKLGYNKDFIEDRNNQIKKVSEFYKFNKVYQLGFTTTKLHLVDFSDLINSISKSINEIKPEIVYMINRTDIHTDHQIAAKAIISCTKSFRYSFIKKILMYECISETEIAPALPENLFLPNVYSDITDFIEKKIEIMKIYKSEIQKPPLPRSLDNIKSIARYRGASSGCNYAEAFMLIREVF
ncbi:MAG: PIG-L deacetylase family protein [Clostridiaceae bacterium]